MGKSSSGKKRRNNNAKEERKTLDEARGDCDQNKGDRSILARDFDAAGGAVIADEEAVMINNGEGIQIQAGKGEGAVMISVNPRAAKNQIQTGIGYDHEGLKRAARTVDDAKENDGLEGEEEEKGVRRVIGKGEIADTVKTGLSGAAKGFQNPRMVEGIRGIVHVAEGKRNDPMPDQRSTGMMRESDGLGFTETTPADAATSEILDAANMVESQRETMKTMIGNLGRMSTMTEARMVGAGKVKAVMNSAATISLNSAANIGLKAKEQAIRSVRAPVAGTIGLRSNEGFGIGMQQLSLGLEQVSNEEEVLLEGAGKMVGSGHKEAAEELVEEEIVAMSGTGQKDAEQRELENSMHAAYESYNRLKNMLHKKNNREQTEGFSSKVNGGGAGNNTRNEAMDHTRLNDDLGQENGDKQNKNERWLRYGVLEKHDEESNFGKDEYEQEMRDLGQEIGDKQNKNERLLGHFAEEPRKGMEEKGIMREIGKSTMEATKVQVGTDGEKCFGQQTDQDEKGRLEMERYKSTNAARLSKQIGNVNGRNETWKNGSVNLAMREGTLMEGTEELFEDMERAYEGFTELEN